MRILSDFFEVQDNKKLDLTERADRVSIGHVAGGGLSANIEIRNELDP